MKEIVVSIQCITFNQKKYLRQTLDGFLRQQTTFGYEIIVHDDASTDGTTDIVREYAEAHSELIIPMYEVENQWSTKGMKPVFGRMTQMSRGRYIAYCEGDDFWQDPLKLQKQVEALEQHPEATLCYTGFQTVDAEGQPYTREDFEACNRQGRSGEIFFRLLKNNIVFTPTTLFRKEVFTSSIYLDTPLRLDYFAFLSAAALGTAIYLPDRTACYRQTPTGAMATQLPWVKERYMAIREYFLQQYALGHVHKPWSVAGFHTLMEALNQALRKKMSGDGSQWQTLMSARPLLRCLYPWVWWQVKSQNWRYKTNCD